jgi:hypothetical protein
MINSDDDEEEEGIDAISNINTTLQHGFGKY